MNKRRNPFTPSFGKIPPCMAGRRQILDDLIDSFENGAGDPNLTTIFVGARGTGKTALLTQASREAQSRGWVAVDVSARPGMLDSILIHTRKSSSHLVDDSKNVRITGVQLGQAIGLQWDVGTASQSDWRLSMETLLDELAEHDAGLLITVDEVRADLDEMIDLISVYQHFVREDRKVGLLMAGLPYKVSELLAQEDISFLRRAQHRYFGRIFDYEIRDAFQRTVTSAERTIGDDALDLAVESIEGFPYMMQLVGYHSWTQHPNAPEISYDDVVKGMRTAHDEMRESIFETTYKEFSPKDREFLFAMLEDAHISSITDIAKRMGVANNYAGQYKKRLLEGGIIGERGRGQVSFELPGFRKFLEGKRL